MKRLLLVLPACFCLTLAAADKPTLTEQLVGAFTAAWESREVDAVYNLLAPDCVFRSPFQTHCGRDDIRETVLRWNLAHIHDTRNCVEEQSKVAGDFAYSVGRMDYSQYDDDGNVVHELKANYIYVFTREPDREWKVQMMIFHEPRPD